MGATASDEALEQVPEEEWEAPPTGPTIVQIPTPVAMMSKQAVAVRQTAVQTAAQTAAQQAREEQAGAVCRLESQASPAFTAERAEDVKAASGLADPLLGDKAKVRSARGVFARRAPLFVMVVVLVLAVGFFGGLVWQERAAASKAAAEKQREWAIARAEARARSEAKDPPAEREAASIAIPVAWVACGMVLIALALARCEFCERRRAGAAPPILAVASTQRSEGAVALPGPRRSVHEAHA